MERKLKAIYIEQQYTKAMMFIGFIIVIALQVMILVKQPNTDIQLKSLENSSNNLPPIEQLVFDY